jgi:hypothetical protein
MEFFYGYIYPACMVICVLWMLSVWVGWIHMLMSIIAIIGTTYALLKGIVTRNFRRMRNDIGEFTWDLPGGVFGFIPGVAFFVVIFFIFGFCNYQYEHAPSIPGVNAKIIAIKHVVRAGNRDAQYVYETIVERGDGRRLEATLIRDSYDKQPKVGDIVPVATQDGVNFRDRFEDYVIRPVIGSTNR